MHDEDNFMKFEARIFLSFVFSAVSVATTIVDAREFLLLDRLSAMASSRSEESQLALDLLQLIALGRMPDVPLQQLEKIGLAANAGIAPLRKGAFIESKFRDFAFHEISTTRLDSAFDFLTNLKRSDLVSDPTGFVWTAAQIALSNAQLSKISDVHLKVEFLEALAIPHTPSGDWAVEQLCDSGTISSSSITRAFFKEVSKGSEGYGEEKSRFCEARMQVVFSNPDRAIALGSILKAGENSSESFQLKNWAVHQLVEMDSPAADSELKRFQKQVRAIPFGKAGSESSAHWSEVIDRLMARNQVKRAAIFAHPRL